MLTIGKEHGIQGATIVDKIEASIYNSCKLIELPLIHIFTPKLYGRIIHMRAGAILTSRTHKYEHQFVISQGCIQVINELTGEKQTFKAPYHGITKAGTRRALLALTDTMWHTFHVTNLTDPDEIVKEVTEDHYNPLFISQ